MKGNFKRLLAFLLMLTVLVSVLSVFATATDEEVTEEEEEETAEVVELFLNRSFDEGWGMSNGFSSNHKQVTGANFFVDRETGLDYKNNYFLRTEFGDRTKTNSDHYFYFNAGSFTDYMVLQYDIKVDDALHYDARVAYSQVKSGTGQNQILAINKDEIKVFGETICDTSTEWVTLTYVFDFTADTEGVTNSTTCEYGTCIVTATDADGEELGIVEASKVWSWSTMRFGNHDSKSTVVGESICYDDFHFYATNTGRVLERAELDALGYGTLVNANTPHDIIIDSESVGSGSSGAASPIDNSVCFKVGVEYCLKNGEQRAPIRVTEDGVVYGAPMVYNGKIYLAVEVLLDMLEYEYYTHSNGLAYDVSSGLSATSIYAGRTSAVADGKDVYLTAAPEYIVETIKGVEYKYLGICIDDIETLFPGIFMMYDTMGLIIVSRVEVRYDHEAQKSEMLDLMKKFIYPTVDSAVIRDLVTEQTTVKNGEALKHPYIYATQDQFDMLANAHTLKVGDEGYDPYLDKSLDAYIDAADKVVKTWAASVSEGEAGWDAAYLNYTENKIGIYNEIPGNGNDVIYLPYLSAKPGNAKDINHVGRRNASGKIITAQDVPTAAQNNNGYDEGGRQSGSQSIGEKIVNLAFAYQVTGNITYAMLGYELLTGLAEWDHWGPGHFLNCADSAQRYAVSYDWLYNAIVELETSEDPAIVALREENEYGYSKQVVADGLYWNGLYAGYTTIFEKKLPENRVHPELTTGQILPGTTHGYTSWSRATQNWNCVCNCGIILSALALLDETDATRISHVDAMLTECYDGLINAGLDCYAPDGSYPEGSGYWEYGTLQFFKTIAAFKSACGTDFNLFSAPGIDKTCYYAIHIVSNDTYRFGYHDDGGAGELDSSWYIMVGEGLGDEGVIQLRMNKIRNGMNLQYGDLFYWNKEYVDSEYVLPKSYFMEGIDTFVIRDEWEKGSLYTGLHGGENQENHGHIDAGTFIYVNDGIYWFCELGAENYNVGGYFSNATRYTFYKTNTEGQNTICITGDQANVKYGQRSDATAKTVAYGENEHGGFQILDMKDCYYYTGNPNDKKGVNYGYRGILVTNDFKTTVIQDDISFKTMNNLYWFAHTTQNIEIDESGRTAYLTAKKGQVLRVTLLSNVSSYKFVSMTAYETVLDLTVRRGENKKEEARDEFTKLAIQAENALTFNVAVVIERVESKDDTTPVGYTVEDYRAGMYDHVNQKLLWTPYADRTAQDNTTDLGSGDGLVIKPQNPTDIPLNESLVNSNIAYINILEEDRYGRELVEFYKKMIEIEYIGVFMPEVTGSDSYLAYLEYKVEYNDFVKAMGSEFYNLSLLSKAMIGL